MKRILLTGGTGFLGGRLLKGLVDKTTMEVVVIKRSFSNTFRIDDMLSSPRVKIYDLDKTELEAVFQGSVFEAVIHCATNYGRDNEDVMNIVDSNLVLPLRILQLAIARKVPLFINSDTILDKAISHYSLSKSHFLDWLRSSSGQIKCVNLSLEHFYGAFDNHTKFTSYVINSFLSNAEEIDLTEGDQRRFFIHVDDVVNAFLTVLDSTDQLKDDFNSFDVSAEDSVKIKEFVLLAKKLTGNTSTRVNFGKLPYRTNEVMTFLTNIRKLKGLGWAPLIGLEEGLTRTIIEERRKLNT